VVDVVGYSRVLKFWSCAEFWSFECEFATLGFTTPERVSLGV
jgi:hypothetical protein